MIFYLPRTQSLQENLHILLNMQLFLLQMDLLVPIQMNMDVSQELF